MFIESYLIENETLSEIHSFLRKIISDNVTSIVNIWSIQSFVT